MRPMVYCRGPGADTSAGPERSPLVERLPARPSTPPARSIYRVSTATALSRSGQQHSSRPRQRPARDASVTSKRRVVGSPSREKQASASDAARCRCGRTPSAFGGRSADCRLAMGGCRAKVGPSGISVALGCRWRRFGWGQASRQAAARASWCLWSFRRLCVALMSRHSVRTAERPRLRNRPIPRLDFVWANTGSTIAWRLR